MKKNPSGRAVWQLVAANTSSMRYGVDERTPITWAVVKKKVSANDRGYVLPAKLTNSRAFKSFMKGAKRREQVATLIGMKTIFRGMLKK